MGRRPTFGGSAAKEPNAVERLQQRLDDLRALRAEWEAMPLEQRDMKYLNKLHAKIKTVRSGLRAAGALYGS